jgi:hypothetical protein
MQNHPRSSPLCICGEFLWTSKLSLQVLAAVTVAVPTSTRARVLEGRGDLGTCTTYALCFRVDIANGVAPGRMAAGSGSCLPCRAGPGADGPQWCQRCVPRRLRLLKDLFDRDRVSALLCQAPEGSHLIQISSCRQQPTCIGR